MLVGSNLRDVLLSRTKYRTTYIYEKRDVFYIRRKGISTCILLIFARRNTERISKMVNVKNDYLYQGRWGEWGARGGGKTSFVVYSFYIVLTS